MCIRDRDLTVLQNVHHPLVSYLWPYKNPSFSLASLTLGSFDLKHINAPDFLSIAFTKVIVTPNLIRNGGK